MNGRKSMSGTAPLIKRQHNATGCALRWLEFVGLLGIPRGGEGDAATGRGCWDHRRGNGAEPGPQSLL